MENQDSSQGTKRLFRSTGVSESVRVYIPATIIYRGISFIRGFALAWFLAKQTGQYGLLTIALQVINIFAPLVSIGLNEAITRYVPLYRQKNQIGSFISRSVLLVLGITFVACVILTIFSGALGKVLFASGNILPNESIRLAQACFVTIFAIVTYFFAASILKGLRFFTLLSVMEILHGVLFLALSLAGVYYTGANAEIVIWAYTISLLIPAILCGILLAGRMGGQETNEIVEFGGLARQLIKFGFWAAIAGIFWQSWQIYSLWFLTKFSSAANSDIFAAGRLIGQLIIIVGTAFSIVVMTTVCSCWENKRRELALQLYDVYAKFFLLLLLGCGIVMIILREPLSKIFPSQFAGISGILPQIILFFQFATVLTFLAIHFVILEKTRLMLWPWLAGLLSNIILGFLWIRGPHALIGAVDASAWSALPAILVTVILIIAEKHRISLGLTIIILGSITLILPGRFGTGAFACLLLWSAISNTIFTHDEKKRIIAKILGKINSDVLQDT